MSFRETPDVVAVAHPIGGGDVLDMQVLIIEEETTTTDSV